MSFEAVRHYEDLRAEIISEVIAYEGRSGPVLVYGSVSRAFGPFSDVDIITLSGNAEFQGVAFRGAPFQEHQFTVDDYEDYLARSPRGWHAAADGVLIDDATEVGEQARDIFDRQHEYIDKEGRGDYVALMLAEQAGDTERPDIKTNDTHYALKRALGSKRANTRAYQMLLMVSDPAIFDSLPSEKIQAYIDSSFLDQQTLESMYGLHELLGKLNRGERISKDNWIGLVAITSSWNQQVNELGEEFVVGRLKPDFEIALRKSQSSTVSEQRQALEYIKKDPRGIEARTVLWRLASNLDVDAEVLNGVWAICELSPKLLREIGCVAVQSPQFSSADISPDSPLLGNPDVQFSLNYKMSGHLNQTS